MDLPPGAKPANLNSVVVKMLKIAICDDEPLTVQDISKRLADYLEEKRVAASHVEVFSSGRALLERAGDFALIFLDIQMERPDGMETARLLRRRGVRSLIVFITALQEYVFDAFEVEACGYLVKPLDGARFLRTMDRALKLLEQRAAKTLVIQRGTGREVAALDEILYCEVQGRKVYLHKAGGEVVDYYGKLEDLERRVDRRFFKCHRSYLVNLDYVRRCQAGQVTLLQGESVPVSRLRERDLTQALLRRMEENSF